MFDASFISSFRDTILYTHDTLTLDEVYDTSLSKEKMKQILDGPKNQAGGLFIRRRSQERNFGRNSRR